MIWCVLIMILRSPNLLLYALSPLGRLDYHQTLTSAGNILDFLALGEQCTLLISFDNVHVPWSTKDLRHVKISSHVSSFALPTSGVWEPCDGSGLENFNEWASFTAQDAGSEDLHNVLGGLLYNTETLRKRGAEEDAQ